jgi:hypothetical protein
MMNNQCEHQYDCDPGDMFARRCKSVATNLVEFSYQSGKTVEKQRLCKLHADLDIATLNRWGQKYGHFAREVSK